MNSKALFCLRVVLAIVWIYNGFYLKLWSVDPTYLQLAESVPLEGLSPLQFLQFIGLSETLLGLGVVSGVAYTFVCGVQFRF